LVWYNSSFLPATVGAAHSMPLPLARNAKATAAAASAPRAPSLLPADPLARRVVTTLGTEILNPTHRANRSHNACEIARAGSPKVNWLTRKCRDYEQAFWHAPDQ
jgi:hypothetical protein